jgi:hypothetical protein
MRTEKLGIEYKCQKCGKRKEDVRYRQVKLENYMGPCGDSFCAGSCTGSSCWPVSMTICNACTKLLAKPGTEGSS